MKGGKILGQGYKSIVYDVCVSDMNIYNANQFCKKEFQTTDKIIAYVYDFSKQRSIAKCIPVDLFRTLLTIRGYVVKEFLDNSSFVRKIIAAQSFQNEIKGFESVLGVMQTPENASKYTVIGMPMTFPTPLKNVMGNVCVNAVTNISPLSHFLLGFKIQSGTSTKYYALNKSCGMGTLTERLQEQAMSEDQFTNLVKDILEVIVILQQNNMAHGDIKLDNILVCSNGTRDKYILIDWEYSRELTMNYILGNVTGIKYKGSAPLYFRIHFPMATKVSYEIAARNYMKETGGTAEYINLGYKAMKKLLSKADTQSVFEDTKYALDLHAMGLILSGVIARNPSLSKYTAFVQHLVTYTFDNARAALEYFTNNVSKNISS